MPAKITQIRVRVSPIIKEQLWEEATRLHLTPSVWVRQALHWSLERSMALPAPNEYVITLTEKQAVELRKQGYRIDYHPIED